MDRAVAPLLCETRPGYLKRFSEPEALIGVLNKAKLCVINQRHFPASSGVYANFGLIK